MQMTLTNIGYAVDNLKQFELWRTGKDYYVKMNIKYILPFPTLPIKCKRLQLINGIIMV